MTMVMTPVLQHKNYTLVTEPPVLVEIFFCGECSSNPGHGASVYFLYDLCLEAPWIAALTVGSVGIVTTREDPLEVTLRWRED